MEPTEAHRLLVSRRMAGIAVVVLLLCPGSCIPWPPAVWSPDGKQLAFFVENGIWIAERGTWDTRPVYRSGGVVSGPLWTRDGASLVFLELGDNRRELLVRRAPARGGTPQTVRQFPCPEEAAEGLIGDEPHARKFLRISLHGARSLLALELPVVEDGGGTCIMDLDTGRQIAFLSDLARPAWAPDGALLAGIGGHDGELVLFSLDGQKFTMVRTVRIGERPVNSDESWGIAWSPDSRMVLAESGDEDGTIWLIHADGSQPPRKLAQGRFPSFAPDGRRITMQREIEQKGEDAIGLLLRELSSDREAELARSRETLWPAVSPVSWTSDARGYAMVWIRVQDKDTCVPVVQVVDHERAHWLPATITQAVGLAASLEGEGKRGLEDDRPLAEVVGMYKEALSAYEGLRKRFPRWRWHALINARCKVIREAASLPIGDLDKLLARVEKLPQSDARAKAADLLAGLLWRRDRKDDALGLLRRKGGEDRAAWVQEATQEVRKLKTQLMNLKGTSQKRGELLLELGEAHEELLDFGAARAAYEQACKGTAADSQPHRKAAEALAGIERRRLEKLLLDDALQLRLECPLGENIFSGARSACQAIGPPDAFGSEQAAWTPPKDTGVHWLEVLFDPPSKAHGLSVVQCYAARGIVGIDIVGTGGECKMVWKPDAAEHAAANPLRLSFPETPYAVRSARLYTHSSSAFGTNGIDAVQLHCKLGDQWASEARDSENCSGPMPEFAKSQLGELHSAHSQF